METTPSGPSSLNAAKHVKVDRNDEAAHVLILLLNMKEKTATNWDEMWNTSTAMAMSAVQV